MPGLVARVDVASAPAAGSVVDMKTRIVVIDNYDSFVYNLVQYIGELDAEPLVVRNDEIDVAGLKALNPDGILISPGPVDQKTRVSRARRSSTSPKRASRSSASVLGISASGRSMGQRSCVPPR